MSMSFPKGSKPDEPGTWYLDDGPISLGRPLVTCPVCERPMGRLTNHAIEADGTVHASVECPNRWSGVRCSFHQMIRLLDWTHGLMPPEPPAR